MTSIIIPQQTPRRPDLATIDSNPSLTHPSFNASTDDHLVVPAQISERLLTPVERTRQDPSIQGESELLLSPSEHYRVGVSEGTKPFGRLNLTKSVSNLRTKGKGEKKNYGRKAPGRGRAMSASHER